MGSLILPQIPAVGYIESKFDIEMCLTYMRDRWHISIYYCAIYLAIIFAGQRWMSTRKPFDLRMALFLWNVGLAAFSIIGTLSVVPNLLDRIFSRGIINSCCRTDALRDPHLAVWALLFAFSKVFELGDTVFIVLRKSPLSFLHWYHHITVFVYTWYGLAYGSAIGHWFSSMNFTVHSVMYTYYATKALGWHVPKRVALLITVMQISQMFGGLIVILTAWYSKHHGMPCEIYHGVVYVGLGIYASYAVLFIRFFLERYCSTPTKKTE